MLAQARALGQRKGHASPTPAPHPSDPKGPTPARMKGAIDLSTYLITDPGLCARRGVVETAVAAVRGGATVVQLRDKHASDEALVALGQRLRRALADTPARLLINDRVDVAIAIGADGVHLGQSDADVGAARALLGPDAIIGLSVQQVATARRVDPTIVDYCGIGPVFATATKPDHAVPLGFDGLAAVCAACPVPAVAIGGLRAEHARDVIAAGARGLAIISAICAAPDPEAAAREIAHAIGLASNPGVRA